MLDILTNVNWMLPGFPETGSLLDFVPFYLAAEPSPLAQWGTWFYNIMLVALGLGFVIFVHELGHFLAAKLFGVKCEKFYVGFDVPIKIGPFRLPSKLVHFQWGETEYGIGAIPLGGYVKMLGQDDDPRNAEEEAKRIRVENPNATQDDPNQTQLDPRSFPAKSVGARMVIISAGVVMNLIFGVLMAAWAFGFGVSYEPAIIGELNPGDPGWMQDLRPGDKIRRIARTHDQEMSFRDMFMSVLFHGIRNANEPFDVEIDRNGEIISKKITGTTAHSDPKGSIKRLMMGMGPASNTQIRTDAKSVVAKHIVLGFENSSQYTVDLKPGDVISGVNGQPLSIGSHSDKPLEYTLNQYMHPRANEPLKLQVDRKPASANGQPERVEVVSNPLPMKSFGVLLAPGGVSAVQPDSPAAAAGIERGDSLLEFNGKPIQDSYYLWLSMTKLRGEKVSLKLEKSNRKIVDFEWTVPESFVMSPSDNVLAPVGLELPGSGIVFSVSNMVSGVVPGSKAEQNGIQGGDIVRSIQFDATAEKDSEFLKEVFEYRYKWLLEPTMVDTAHNMQFFHSMLQTLRTGMPLTMITFREGTEYRNNLEIQIEKDWNWPDRGFALTPLQFQHKTTSVATALSMGTHEIWRRIGNVVEFLELLIRGKMPFQVVGGPGMIAVEATDAASKGISPLLMFLVMLSANLAIVNFLPIPALDGGHMVFLTAEAVRGKPVDEALQMKLTMVGVLGLLCLMGAVIINDTINLTKMFGG